MNYAAEYDHVLKYAHRTPTELQPHLDNITRGWRELGEDRHYADYMDRNRDSMGVLADYLEDQSDPRSALVRRMLDEGADYPRKMTYIYPTATKYHEGHGYELQGVKNENHPERSIYMGWYPHDSEPPSSSTPPFGITGHFTPDEAHDLVDRLPEPVASHFRKHLDRMHGLDQNP